MSSKSVDVFNVSTNRLRAASFQDEEERQNAEYAERHNLQALFAEFATQLREKDPKTEQEAERVLLDLLSHRKAERDRAALRLHFHASFEVNLDNGRKVLKLTTGPETSTLHIVQKTRAVAVDDNFTVSMEQAEELTELFYELGRFAVESAKGEQIGFISIDDRDVYLLAGGKDCSDVGDELFNMALLMKTSSGNN
ncbi:hypothetical protein ABB37_05015 [Leptomonas pyrrhocoris]|uniref:Uncharacterized protein n=1 Tax=Leptomonas pyrrhocoris TaxID=157538 RepID=A0A0M9G0X3_LEPPY|nr:hypothetical protein ABB37_05015 [Leptomonas pyrrhocoris]XP_015658411.1 hypothetical protein ABB37_05015 [Leptomonas pyrrhocoris]XP_015658412.1 hypothetical protein ABB37_05015 [Leptomonas pyrrhocoris]KPA79971.1 hypothetical protein ABB37_05015 [Leptomonas pyrrhocoris]KPA79972.1 hypothetical protein ABB37_05015 [Leptomonas pyrrhocoris]KPA79973.1 hypothetical protein ABB37_05015 [Leptomonas pyrrhocoris]|eukprot:XP_015658410.1 hypothetical protein ABB37_05015 [Leptomonas pyrrhocoris]